MRERERERSGGLRRVVRIGREATPPRHAPPRHATPRRASTAPARPLNPKPCILLLTLTPIGTPASGPTASPAAMRASRAAAAARAPAASTVMNARTPGSAPSRRASHSSVTSTAERSPAWTARAISRRAGGMVVAGDSTAAAAAAAMRRGSGAVAPGARRQAAAAPSLTRAWRPAPHKAPRIAGGRLVLVEEEGGGSARK